MSDSTGNDRESDPTAPSSDPGPEFGASWPPPGGPSGPTYGAPGTGPDWQAQYGQSYQPPRYEPPNYQPPQPDPSGYPPPNYAQPGYPPPGYGAYPAQPAYPYATPDAPYGRHPVTGEPYSDKQKITAGLLQILPLLVGIPGIGRLYLGYTTIGLVQLVGGLVAALFTLVLIGLPFWIGLCVWSLVDGIMAFTGSLRDPSGRPLRD